MSTENIRFLRLPAIIMRTGLSRSTIYKYISEGTFPKQISLGCRTSAWVESEVNDWMRKRIELSRKDES